MVMLRNFYWNKGITTFGLKHTQSLKTKYSVKILGIMLLTYGIYSMAYVLIPKVIFGLFKLKQTHGQKQVTL